MTRFLVVLLAGLFITVNTYAETSLGFDPSQISRLTGAKGQINAKEEIYTVYQPRDDLQISMSGIKMIPSMGLVSWVAFKKINSDLAMVGNLVLTEDQIKPIIDLALKNGIRITSLENHYMWESPKVMFMHIEGTGKEKALASTVGKLFKEITLTSRGNGIFPLGMVDVKKSKLNPYVMDAIFHTRGNYKDGVYRIIFEKRQALLTDGAMKSWASFAGSDNEAIVVGDFAIEQAALDKVLAALHNAGFYIESIHPQATPSNPHMVCLHFLGVGTTRALAKGVRTALRVPVQKSTDFNVYPIITFPDGQNIFQMMSPMSSGSNNNIMLNIDISYFSKSALHQPVFQDLDAMNAKKKTFNQVKACPIDILKLYHLI